MKEKALIAMSGGVDSSVAAYLMIEQGYDCIGATMKLQQGEEDIGTAEQGCCSSDDVEDARSVAFRLGIPYYVFNFTEDFRKKVIEPFISAYENGATPNPCVACNRYLKFERFYDRARELGCDYVVTGHYGRVERQGGRFLLKKALNAAKDQSYVLYAMTQEQLAHTKFPLGEMDKEETRRIAGEQGFLNSDKPDSQDICFVPDGNYAEFIRRQTGKEYPEGDFVNREGKVLGRHKGIIHYTIGQRKGLGIAVGEPVYVCRICPEANQVVLGQNKDLFTRDFDAVDVNWIAWEKPPESFRAKARVRYRHKEQSALVTVTGENQIHVRFDEPQRAITKGQSVVLYDEDIVLGGGTIVNDK